jgi:hypothetical protein
MDTRIQLVTGAVTLVGLIVIIDLVRRRRLLERYALLWLLSAFVLLGLAVWREALDRVAETLGVADPPNALFIVGFGFVLWLLLHFSVAVSRLSDQTKILAQRLAIAEERLRRAESEAPETQAPVNSDAEERQRVSA